MAASELLGVNFTTEGEEISFFTAKGMRTSKDRWAINCFLGGLFVEVEPSSMLPDIRETFSDDEAAGKGNQIAMLIVGARQAVVMWLEGLLTREHLKHVTEGPNFVDIPGVQIDGREILVRVKENPMYAVASADGEGNIL